MINDYRFLNETSNLGGDQRPEGEQEPTSKTRRPYTSTSDDYGGKEFKKNLKKRIFLHLTVGTRPSLQVDGPDIQYFLEGQNARITMLLVGYPVPDITWYHDVSFILKCSCFS